MVDNEYDIGGFESLAEFKKSVQQEKIRNLVLAEYMKTPIGKEPNRKTLSKNLKISEASISDAFRDVEKAKQDNDFSAAITKALGIATPMLLLQEDNISKLSNFLNDNEEIAALGAGVYFTWNNFVKPRIDDPKNDLSELEVIIELFKSATGQAFVAGIFGLIAGNRLLETIEKAGGGIKQGFDNFGAAIMNGLINFGSNIEDEIEEAAELFGQKCIICVTTGEKFENFYLWVLTQEDTFSLLFNPIYGLTQYYKQKKQFIDKCGSKNIMLCEDYENRLPDQDGIAIPEEAGTGPEISVPVEVPEEIATAPGEDGVPDSLSTMPPEADMPQDEEGEETQAPAGGQAGTPGSVGVIPGTGGTKLFDPFEIDPK